MCCCISTPTTDGNTNTGMICVTLNMLSAAEECCEPSGNFTLSAEWPPCISRPIFVADMLQVCAVYKLRVDDARSRPGLCLDVRLHAVCTLWPSHGPRSLCHWLSAGGKVICVPVALPASTLANTPAEGNQRFHLQTESLWIPVTKPGRTPPITPT